ncbi:MAG TPA: nucleotide sugar dehydrogenase [Flavisolibacter sp.]|nr:nucleotide sugar dehydrogenase [Flavisolibacter sp.]
MIAILGLGFVGLTTALGFSKKGNTVYGIDTSAEKVEGLKRGIIPFHEPGLKEALNDELGKRFILDAPMQEALHKSEVIFICVGTPEKEDGSADLGFLLAALESVLRHAGNSFKPVVIKSSVPPSTIQKQVKPFVEAFKSKNTINIALASNPEFLREGYAWDDFMNPDRIIVGIEDDRVRPILAKLYQPFGAPVHFVSFNTAEYIKYLSNTLLSTLISYSNEMAMIADHIGGIDVPEAFKVLHQDKRWSGNPATMAGYVFPGCGYGGYCLPKDTAALQNIAAKHGYNAKLLQANIAVNQEIKEHVIKKVIADTLPHQMIGILGLSFKAGSDDVRLSPSLSIIQLLLQNGYQNIVAFDPMANKAFDEAYGLPINYASSLEEVYEKTDVLVLLTGWPLFKEHKEKLNQKKLFDFRYLL